MIKQYINSFFFFAFSVQVSIFAQNEPYKVAQIDSILLNASSARIYENPTASIDLGLSIYENTSYSIKIRTRALMLVSLGYTSKRNYQKALEYVIKADEISKTLNDKVLQVEILFRTGMLYQQLKIFDKSIEYLEKTEQMALIYPIRDSVGKYLASSYVVKGFIYKDNLNCDIAQEFFDRGINEYQKLKNVEINTNLSIVYYNMGNCYIQLSEYGMAKNSFNKSIEFAKLEKANSLIAFAQKGLAAVYTEEGEYQQALDLLNTALQQSNNVGDLVLNSSIYNGLLENHLALNQWDKYQKFYDLYSKTQLEIKISERNSISDALDDDAKHINNRFKSIQKQFSNKIKWFFLIVIITIISVIFIERKNKKIIKTLQKEVETIQNKKLTT